MIERNFSSAHQLRGYRGKCENLHGHNYKIEIYARGKELNNIGLLVDFVELKQAADDLVNEAVGLADADEQAFQAVIDAYKLPATTDELKAARAATIDAALVQAAQTPAHLVTVAGAVVELATELFDVANANVISDVAAAADAARAAATTARVNIDINVVAIKDPGTRAGLAQRTDGLEDKVIMAADSLAARVRERILR